MPLLARGAAQQPGAPGPRSTAWAASCAKAAAVVTVIVGLSIPATDLHATQSGGASEYDLKAAFLFNFAQFVEWPTDAFAASTTPITIGILGADPFGARLDSLVAGETIRNRRLVVRRYRSVEQIDACHVLFIASSEVGRLGDIAKALAHRSILTVGETKDFTARAGVIGFELAQRRMRLRINLGAAASARLSISSKLLRQAQIVESSGGRE